jgi:hypothetical protein
MGMGVINGARMADANTALRGTRRYAAMDEQQKAEQHMFNVNQELARKQTIRSATAAGMSTGASIGTAIYPGLGTLAGSAIGAGIGYVASSGNWETLIAPGAEFFTGVFDDLF